MSPPFFLWRPGQLPKQIWTDEQEIRQSSHSDKSAQPLSMGPLAMSGMARRQNSRHPCALDAQNARENSMTTVIDCRSAPTKPVPDLKAIKGKQHAAWSSGD